MFSGEAKSVKNLAYLEWKREPASGWKLDTCHFYGQLVYHFDEGSYFKMIVIGTNKNENKFNINFQKPKNPLQFEACLEMFSFEYNSLQKEILNYDIEAITFDRLIEVLDLLHKQKYISQALLQDIKLAIAPNNPDLIKLKQAKEMDARKPLFTYESAEAAQLSLNKNLHAFIANANEDNKLYPRTAEEFTAYVIPTIESLLKRKANPNSISHDKTPLVSLIINQACNDHTKQIADLLLQQGAELNARNGYMRTVLHHAALNQNKLWIEFLLEKGADAALLDDEGCTAKQIYLNSCKSNELTVDLEIETMLGKTEPVKRSALKVAKGCDELAVGPDPNSSDKLVSPPKSSPALVMEIVQQPKDEEFVVGPESSSSLQKFAGAPGGPNFNLLDGLVRKPSESKSKSTQYDIPPYPSAVSSVKKYSSSRPGRRCNNCAIS